MKKKMKAWLFTVEIMGYGKNQDEAYQNAIEEGINNVEEPISAKRSKEDDYEEE